MMFSPKIGEKVRIECKNVNLGFVAWRPDTSTFQGTVVEKFHWCTSDEFCMTTGLVRFPIRTIRMSSIVSIEDATGKKTSINSPQSIPTNKEWQVKGSKGNTYIVSRNGNVWSCTCVHSQFRRSDCKHIKEKKDEMK